MHRSRLFWAILGAAGALHLAPAQLYDFNVVAPPSGISGNLAISARTQGTLVGNYDQTNNPTGTRTKPGLFGSFDPTENVPEELLSAQEVGVLARVRWQVEIVFRVWKSCFRIDECRSRNVWRVLCELYAKLMGVVVWHWLVLVWRGGVWERSLYKAARAFQWIAIVLAG